ncbi:MAG TPA: phosphoglucomutase/phosphomannomutase family protein [Ignavibacteria bacterium]|nr:phosphoglucomutase/phosphomannomutase family protein [Ignavibacteria bacterium]HRF66625.1 phosphoglucomutase/phosphomannomutase family protein [Ignavibacteria bacterium]HRJ04479.1 phosphoglucomutase/phosphomannomutase family protein [Ignavibacteria bacterium]HRJ86884.1 phosphoglucomutase/phosphomannomutase family protein [Ignavibacteria bacterium]
MAIKFGTDGWRAVIADEYTFENLKKISKATAIAFEGHPKINNGIAVGYDTRFLSKEFADCAAEVFANHGIKVYLTDSFVTTPTVSLLSRDKNLAYGVMITSSHNPAKYNGFKLKDEFGGSMGPVHLNVIEEKLKNSDSFNYGSGTLEEFITSGKIEYIKGKDYYRNTLKEKIDTDVINSSGVKIIYDAMYGSGQGMMDGIINITAIRNEVNPSFGGSSPEPVQMNLSLISGEMKSGKFDIGIVTDGDADRIAIFDENGEFVDAQKTFALLLTYMVENKKMTGGVVRGFSSSDVIKEICDEYGLKLYTVPIGFKYISELMIKEDILIGAEESGGIGLKHHLPERDGIFNGMMFSEMLAVKKKKMSELIAEIEGKYGKYYYKRIDQHLSSNELKSELIELTKGLKEVAGLEVVGQDTLDGCKLLFKNGWLLVRASGTEPLLRIYTETTGENKTEEILSDIKKKFKL